MPDIMKFVQIVYLTILATSTAASTPTRARAPSPPHVTIECPSSSPCLPRARPDCPLESWAFDWGDQCWRHYLFFAGCTGLGIFILGALAVWERVTWHAIFEIQFLNQAHAVLIFVYLEKLWTVSVSPPMRKASEMNVYCYNIMKLVQIVYLAILAAFSAASSPTRVMVAVSPSASLDCPTMCIPGLRPGCPSECWLHNWGNDCWHKHSHRQVQVPPYLLFIRGIHLGIVVFQESEVLVLRVHTDKFELLTLSPLHYEYATEEHLEQTSNNGKVKSLNEMHSRFRPWIQKNVPVQRTALCDEGGRRSIFTIHGIKYPLKGGSLFYVAPGGPSWDDGLSAWFPIVTWKPGLKDRGNVFSEMVPRERVRWHVMIFAIAHGAVPIFFLEKLWAVSGKCWIPGAFCWVTTTRWLGLTITDLTRLRRRPARGLPRR
ncbi:uncharacterized protein HD556DRAFT_1311321 [Suillus plorans]|uniref:Ferric oxidoreductase domain-containing protein n=1 Tax=Suillus plorans TaxID=116603 RepID=A0A9P7AHG8_9AGAM|nr:uncharacterized protein HD556DRAFT_1311321 [Suillus plorans]KAG1789562.1 hypothetical protein HD556DRAFT_1311321 [Suillus plorans]